MGMTVIGVVECVLCQEVRYVVSKCSKGAGAGCGGEGMGSERAGGALKEG